MKSCTDITDLERLGFMQKLDVAERADDGIEVDEWEKNFLNSFRHSARPTLWFTHGRRAATDRMWMKLGALIGQPYPTDDVRLSSRPAPAALPVAEPDGCMYFVKDDSQRLVRCNAPATKENRAGFRYCDDHAHMAVRAMKQKGVEMALRIYLPAKTEKLKS